MPRERDKNRRVARSSEQVKRENEALVEILRRLSPEERVKYVDRLLARALERM